MKDLLEKTQICDGCGGSFSRLYRHAKSKYCRRCYEEVIAR